MELSIEQTRRSSAAPLKVWRPRQVLITRSALGWAHGREIARRAAELGCEVVELASDRVVLPRAADERSAYKEAKSTLAIVVAPPSKRKLQAIPPSADWRFDLAEGCHAHCQYCYLAGSLMGPPLTRVYANTDEILAGLAEYVGRGSVTSASSARAAEGTTFEASCYADPLGVEHLTGSLSQAIKFFGCWDAPVQLRFTTKFDGVGSLIGLRHARRTRVRMSVNAAPLIRFEGGTSRVADRITALGRLARDGYRVGLTVAPIQPIKDWRGAYDLLFASVAAELESVEDLDLTVELITHRFTPKSKAVLQGWYPGTALDLDEDGRARKLTKFGSTKFVYPAPLMKEMREELSRTITRQLPSAKLLYWT